MKTLWIMCGVPGSGKSWFAKHTLINNDSWKYVSRDDIRFSIVREDEDYFSHENEVFWEFTKEIISGLLYQNYTNVVADATHLNWSSRRKLLRAIEREVYLPGINIIVVVMQTPLALARKRNNYRRGGRACVPENVIRKMYRDFTDPNEDHFHYTAIMRVDSEGDI